VGVYRCDVLLLDVENAMTPTPRTPEERAREVVKTFSYDFPGIYMEDELIGLISHSIQDAVREERERLAIVIRSFDTKGIPDREIKFRIAEAIRQGGAE
jgi:hypothetical protein